MYVHIRVHVHVNLHAYVYTYIYVYMTFKPRLPKECVLTDNFTVCIQEQIRLTDDFRPPIHTLQAQVFGVSL